MFSILFDSPFLFVVLALGAIMFAIAKQEKPEQSRYLNFLLLTLVTFGVILFDNPFKSYLYAGLLFYVYVVYIFIPTSLVFGFISIYKSKRHLQYYPSNYSKILKTNAWILMILSIVNLLMLLMQSEIGIIILVPIVGISSIIQFIYGELERKRVQNLLQQNQEVVPIPDSILNDGDIDEN